MESMRSDIKPENILLHKTSIKLADFGLAKRITDPSGHFQKGCGTPEYAAPELLYGRPYGTYYDMRSCYVRIQNCIEMGFAELICRGFEVLKHNQNGKTSHAHRTTLRYDVATHSVSWTPASTLHQHPKKHFKVHPRTIFLKDVVAVASGCAASRAFAKMKHQTIKDDHCLSLVTESRTLDLETETKGQQTYLVEGLTRLVQMAKQPTLPNVQGNVISTK
ncbi:hypothetical protein DYB31_007055 [Aphanomyces astaci]|uniref:Protein kinase domain-containing protein n=1 Tax=Aphanomyces astaci TaxID=112090 RepID=A0A397F6G2_APHAT|nr:hypothetical protein DYB31_007055 [Aphanomyces astaci]